MRRCYRRTIAICAIFAILAGAVPNVGVAHAAPWAMPRRLRASAHGATTLDRLVDEMLQLLNADRADAGVDPLTLNQPLMELATDHSRDMAARHYFDHTAPGDSDPFERFARKGIRYVDAGENLGQAGGRPLAQEISLINATMMDEPLDGASHHAVIVDPGLHHVGIGICIEPGNTIYLTEDFTN